jgi:FkbH-like protein
LLELHARGIILALCSKNNESDVWEVFENNPNMILKREHISIYRINWNDKASNIREIAAELNIGLDSVVFMDDSEFEVGLVKEKLPEVESIRMPKENPIAYKSIAKSLFLFETPIISKEDKLRGEMYKQQSLRNELKKSTSIEEYLESLEMNTIIRFADKETLPRAAQQTQKTNQFNLTTKRYSLDDMDAYLQDDNIDILTIQLKDKYGDYGIIGTTIIKYTAATAEIDTLLLSCRALGRKVEDLFLSEIIKLCRKKNKKKVIGTFIPSKKNAQVKSFYQDRGFEVQNDIDGVLTSEFDLQKADNFKDKHFFNLISEI